jgi:hypothetical protein
MRGSLRITIKKINYIRFKKKQKEIALEKKKFKFQTIFFQF